VAILVSIFFKIYLVLQKEYEKVEEKLLEQRRQRDYQSSDIQEEISLLEEPTLRNRYFIDIRFEDLGLCSKKGYKHSHKNRNNQ
jgi:hypothetical protein